VTPQLDPMGYARRLRTVADPRTGLAIARTGALTPRRALAGWCAAPWLIGRGASLGILSQINACAETGRPAIHDRDGTLTWWQVDERSSRLARALRGLGVGPEDAVATLVRNGREAVETMFAGQKLGVTLAPLNTWGREQELAALLERLRPKVLIADRLHAEPIASAIPKSTALITAGEGYESVIAAESPAPLLPFAIPRRHGRGIANGSSGAGDSAAITDS